MSKRRFYTEYGRGLTSHVWAVDRDEAELWCSLRGLGERVKCEGTVTCESPFDQPAGVILRCDDYSGLEKLHALTFLAYVAEKSGECRGYGHVELTLGDRGLLHEWVHLELGLHRRPRALRARLLKRVDELEQRVPGYLP